MAKKSVAPVSDQRIDILESLGEFSRFKNIDRASLMAVLEDIFRVMIKKKYGSDENFNVIVNVDKGDMEAFRERTIVPDGDVVDESVHVPLSEALKLDPDYKVGEEIAEKVQFSEFGRRHVTSAKQLLAQRIKELEKNRIIEQYQELQGDIVVGEVYQIWRSEILVMHDENELFLPRAQQIPKDRFKKGDTLRAVIHEVEIRNGTPRVLLSRTSPVFLEKLFEREVPEVYDGTITIKRVVRDPGERAKVAVESYDERIDPVGACVGVRGTRITGIMKELRGENIDVINYTTNTMLLIQRSLSPAKVTSIEIDEEKRHAKVFLKADQISLAIGKGGQNVKLASKLLNFVIDVYREMDQAEQEEDVELDEFKDEIDEWIINLLKGIGCDSAKSVLALTPEELERRTDLERDVVEKIIEILQSEFEE